MRLGCEPSLFRACLIHTWDGEKYALSFPKFRGVMLTKPSTGRYLLNTGELGSISRAYIYERSHSH